MASSWALVLASQRRQKISRIPNNLGQRLLPAGLAGIAVSVKLTRQTSNPVKFVSIPVEQLVLRISELLVSYVYLHLDASRCNGSET